MSVYDSFMDTKARFDARLEELRSELQSVLAQLSAAENSLSEAVLSDATGKSTGAFSSLRKRIKDLSELKADLEEMIRVLEEQRALQLPKLIPAAEEYFRKVEEEHAKKAAEQIQAIKRAKAVYLNEVRKLKEIKDSLDQEASRLNRLYYMAGTKKHIRGRFFELDFLNVWNPYGFPAGTIEREVREAFDGKIHPEGEKLIEESL